MKLSEAKKALKENFFDFVEIRKNPATLNEHIILLYGYDGKSFTCFTTKDGLINQGIWAILEDKTGNLWVGTRETGLYLYDGKTFINYSEYKH